MCSRIAAMRWYFKRIFFFCFRKINNNIFQIHSFYRTISIVCVCVRLLIFYDFYNIIIKEDFMEDTIFFYYYYSNSMMFADRSLFIRNAIRKTVRDINYFHINIESSYTWLFKRFPYDNVYGFIFISFVENQLGGPTTTVIKFYNTKTCTSAKIVYVIAVQLYFEFRTV